MSFSEREGYKPVRLALQIDSFDEETNNKLWDIISRFVKYMDVENSTTANDKIVSRLNDFFIRVNSDIRNQLIENIGKLYDQPGNWSGDEFEPYDYYRIDSNNYSSLKEWWFNEFKFHEKMDMLEFLCECFDKTRYKFNKEINISFKNLSVGYRVNDKNEIIRMNSDEELESVQQAAKETVSIDKSIMLLNKSGDYQNSIKESILAVEEVCKICLGDDAKNTLGNNLKIIGKKFNHHPAFTEALNKLYGFSSDEKGIRHAGNIKSDIGTEEAHFILITCSAFINYLKTKVRNNPNE